MKFKAFFSTFLLSYIFWILFLAQDFNIFKLGYEELITGLVVAVVVGVFCSQFFVKKDGFWLFKKFRLVNLLIFIPIYSIELIKANWDVAKKALSFKKIEVNPSIVKIQTNLSSDWGLSMLSNCITLTPGTITMDIYEEKNKNYLYVHWLNSTTDDGKKAAKIIKGKFEKYIRRIFD